MARPKVVTYLREGKSIGAHKGFAATFNWLVRFCSNLSGDGIGIQVDKRNSDFPCVRLIGAGGGAAGDGYTGELKIVTDLKFNETGDYALHQKFILANFVNGQLIIEGEPTVYDEVVFETAMHSEEN